VIAALLLAAAIATPSPEPVPTLSPTQTLARIRAQFRSHRPPPPYVTYTLVRKQNRSDGYPDVSGSYTYHVWVRTSDRAALKRRVFRDNYEYPPEFDRPAFNEARDPGPPTADVFEPKPARPHPISEAYTPEPTGSEAPIIGRVTSVLELDYRVTGMAIEGNLLHVQVEAISDRERNRLRDIYVDKNTYELVKLVANDKLFVSGSYSDVYGTLFTIQMGMVQGVPVVTSIHGIVGRDDRGVDYNDDGKEVDFTFTNIQFPPTLPDWYFNPRLYGAHQNDAPQ
jgi:hypothetical protein